MKRERRFRDGALNRANRCPNAEALGYYRWVAEGSGKIVKMPSVLAPGLFKTALPARYQRSTRGDDRLNARKPAIQPPINTAHRPQFQALN
jgi:hypothetical protein